MNLLNLKIFTGISYVSSCLLLSNNLIFVIMSLSITNLINSKEQVEAEFNGFEELVLEENLPV